MAERTVNGVQRTRCACEQCKVPCRHMPGMLEAADLEPMAKVFNMGVVQFAKEYLEASQGSLVGDRITGTTMRVPTITPRKQNDGSCVFYKDGLCSVHEVSPAGCAFLDVHMSAEEGKRVSMLIHQHIMKSWIIGDDGYSDLWEILHGMGQYHETPDIEARNAMVAELEALSNG